MSARETRAAFVQLFVDTGKQVDVGNWYTLQYVDAQSCGEGKVKFTYFYAVAVDPASGGRDADAERVATYWKSLGMDARVSGSGNDSTVFASGDLAGSIAFQTGEVGYGISGTSVCVAGDIADLESEIYPEVTPSPAPRATS